MDIEASVVIAKLQARIGQIEYEKVLLEAANDQLQATVESMRPEKASEPELVRHDSQPGQGIALQ